MYVRAPVLERRQRIRNNDDGMQGECVCVFTTEMEGMGRGAGGEDENERKKW